MSEKFEIEIVEGSNKDWEYVEKEDGTIKLLNYKKSKSGSIIIPNIIDGYLVTEIGDNLFRHANNLTKIQLSEGLEKIDDDAFLNCISMEYKIDFPSTVIEIGNFAFYGCKELTGNIDNVALRKIKLGKNVFGGCSKLEGSISVLINNLDEDITVITEGMFSGFEGVTGKLTIPAKITRIEDNAFYGCKNITGLEFENESELISIGNNAFYYCSNISGTVDIPDSVISIGEYAFRNNTNMEYISLSSNLEELGRYAFDNCTLLGGTLVIPSKINNIGEQTFCKCKFEKINFEDGEEEDELTLGTSSFFGNINLNKLKLPNKKIIIGDRSFESCDELEEIENFCNVIEIGEFGFNGDKKIVELECNNLETIKKWAFNECELLKRIKSLNKLKTVGIRAFSECVSLDEIDDYETEIIEFLNNSIVISVDENAFLNCSSLTGTIIDSVENKLEIPIEIAGSSFSGTQIIKKVTLDFSGKTEILEGEYKGATILVDEDENEITEIVIPPNITKIEKYAFSGCTSIEKIEISDSVTTIGSYAFYGCTNLSEVSLSENISYLSTACFSYCENLNNIQLSSNITKLYPQCFSYSGIEEIDLSYITSIGDLSFYKCNDLQRVVFSNSLERIGREAFSNDGSWSENIVIPDSVTEIGVSAFNKTSNTNITVGSGMNYLPKSCFEGNTSLNKIIFRNPQILNIEERAFYGCTNLSSINIDWSSVQNIGFRAFCNCKNLRGTANLSINCVYDVEESFIYCPLVLIQE